MFRHTKELQFTSKPAKPDALYAMKLQELVGGQYGEMSVMMQYLFQGWSCRMPGKYKDMILDIATEEIGHVEMLSTMVARLLEGAPAEVTAQAVGDNPVLGAIVGGMNPQQAIISGGGALPTNSQGVPWSGGYIVASGNLLADFQANVAAEAQSRLQTSRLYDMTDDPGVREMLKFNLARDTFHQHQWLLGIQQLVEDGLADVVEDSRADEENQEHNHTFWSLGVDSAAGEGKWASPEQQVGGQPIEFLAEPAAVGGDDAMLPPPDPKLFATYDGSLGKGTAGDHAGASGLLSKAKKALE